MTADPPVDLRSVLGAFPEGSVIVLDRQLRHVFAAGSTFSAHPPGHPPVEGRTVHELLPPSHAGVVEPHLRAALAGETRRFEFASGGRVFEMRAAPLAHDGAEPDGVLVVVLDVTPRKLAESRQAALIRIADAALSDSDLPSVLTRIHEVLRGLMPADNFYIALLDPETRQLEFPYFVDRADPPPPPRPPGRGITEYVLRTGVPLLADPETYEGLRRSGEILERGSPSIDWVGVPLRLPGHATGESLGVLAVQSYDPAVRYGAVEVELLQFVSTQVAVAVERKRAEERLRVSAEGMRRWIHVLQERNQQIETLRQMVTTLQTCRTVDEVYDTGGRFARRLFRTEAGALLCSQGQNGMLRPVAAWGHSEAPVGEVPAEGCRALRDRRASLSAGEDAVAPCSHRRPTDGSRTLCVPLISQGELLGVLSLTSRPNPEGNGGSLSEATQRLAVTVADGIALAAANMGLRDLLRDQAVRDPLTGLYNRRYMEETFRRELARAGRHGGTLGVLLVDLDGFKAFNDREGHAAGDSLLQQVGRLLGSVVRAEDVACRYGGDEFLVLLPGAAAPDLASRGEQVCSALRSAPAFAAAAVTVSIGAAVHPANGSDLDGLLRAADAALYRAKAAGKDRTVLA